MVPQSAVVAEETYLSAVLLPLLDWLRNNSLGDQLLKKLTDSLSTISDFLDVAEKKKYEDSQVENWLLQLEDIAYEVEDLVDEMIADGAATKLRSLDEMIADGAATKLRSLPWTSKFISALQRSKPKSSRKRFRSEVKSIIERLADLIDKAASLGLEILNKRVNDAGGEAFEIFHSATSSADESTIYGRRKDKDAIIEWLLSDDATEDKVSVLSIFSKPGMGKTTLADLAFNDQKLKSQFDRRIWVSAGESFNAGEILQADPPPEYKELAALKCYPTVKKLLLVLDDVLHVNSSEWFNLLIKLRDEVEDEIKIIVITHNENVADSVSTMPVYHLNGLCEEDWWSVFAKHAFRSRSPSSVQDSVPIAKEIVTKCRGSPLAAKALGSVFCLKSVEEWNATFKNLVPKPRTNSFSMEILNMSYSLLSTNLKLCFTYCSIFPLNYKFEKEELVRLWMAEGFLHQTKGKIAEDAGEDFFAALLSMSFFQPSLTAKSRFVMHYLFRDLALQKSQGLCTQLRDTDPFEICSKVLHLSHNSVNSALQLMNFFMVDRLRTFLHNSSGGPIADRRDLRHYELERLLMLPRLRVLSLHFITEMPEEIGRLKHLRYLDLSYTSLKTLPSSLTSLHNLQTLVLSFCCHLKVLPSDIWKLINLRHLFISPSGVENMPSRLCSLSNLRTLSDFIVGYSGSRINELSGLSNLRALSISRLDRSSEKDALDAKLKQMPYLDKLALKWGRESDDPEKSDKVIKNLVPPRELKELVIENYGGTKFPVWFEVFNLSNLVNLSLIECQNCLLLPSVGQLPSLQVLIIKRLCGVRRLQQEFYGTHSFSNKWFQSLKILRFEGMTAWQEWKTPDAEYGEFARLQELYLIDCPELVGDIPPRLPSLRELVISRCTKLVDSFPLIPAQCEVWKDGKLVQTRTEDKSSSSGAARSEATEGIGSIDGIADYSQADAPLQQEASAVPTKTFKQEVSDQPALDSTTKIGSFPGKSEIIEVERLEKLQSMPESSSCPQVVAPRAALDTTIHEDDEGAEQIPHSGVVLQTSDDQDVFPFSSPTTEAFIQEISCEPTLDCTKHEIASSSSIHAHDQAESFGSCPEKSEPVVDTRFENLQDLTEIPSLQEKDASQPTMDTTIHDADDGPEQSLSQDRKEHQYSSPGVLEVSDIEELGKLPTYIHSLRIEGCDILESLPPEILNSNPFLLHLHIIDCGSLTSFPEPSPSTRLEMLHIRNCRKFNFSTVKLLPQLDHLCIGSSCDSLDSFLLDFFPKLRVLCLWDCITLNSLSTRKVKDLMSLESLEIRDCPNLKSFLPEGLLAPKLMSIFICKCENLQFLPSQMCRLESLQSLFISQCPRLESLPKDGLPASLNLLCITSCDKLTMKREWKLCQLEALTLVEIEGGCEDIESFPEDGLLPPNLVSLRISKLPNLKSLNQNGLEKLTSLEKLEIDCCKRLRSLPDDLPSSLSSLYIRECSLLKSRLKNKKGIDWLRIADISNVYIDGEESH